jgi:segregation and condensation protein B
MEDTDSKTTEAGKPEALTDALAGEPAATPLAADGSAGTESASLEENDAGAEPPALPPEQVRAVLEALIFAAPEPVTPRQLGQILAGVPREDWQAALEELRAEYARPGRGLQLVDVAGGYQITTRPEHNDYLQELLDPRSPARLSVQALQTLAVIAYKQPVTLPEIIELRGVKSGGVIKTLLEKHLIRIEGRKEVVGRPILYGTTKEFLLHFGLKDLTELPKIEEFAEVLGEEVDVAGLKRAIEAPRPAEAPLAEEPGEAPGEDPGDSALAGPGTADSPEGGE